ncbi:MAG: hypothetical protein IPO13_09295 [Rhodocyclaceae bacterium]|jgi:hypothetical protein|nr:hypothetical protein [Rhodocyclaceae bacterium]
MSRLIAVTLLLLCVMFRASSAEAQPIPATKQPDQATAPTPKNAASATAEAEAASIQRLFFTAEKRASLDRQRNQNLQQIRSLQGATLNFDGIVQRSSGKSTVWINGQPQHENEAASNGVTVFLSPKKPGSAQIAPGDEAPVSMKVGETINRATGERNTRLGDGTVTTPATPAKAGH